MACRKLLLVLLNTYLQSKGRTSYFVKTFRKKSLLNIILPPLLSKVPPPPPPQKKNPAFKTNQKTPLGSEIAFPASSRVPTRADRLTDTQHRYTCLCRKVGRVCFPVRPRTADRGRTHVRYVTIRSEMRASEARLVARDWLTQPSVKQTPTAAKRHSWMQDTSTVPTITEPRAIG